MASSPTYNNAEPKTAPTQFYAPTPEIPTKVPISSSNLPSKKVEREATLSVKISLS